MPTISRPIKKQTVENKSAPVTTPQSSWWQSLKDAVYRAYEGIIQFSTDNKIVNLIKSPFKGLANLNQEENFDKRKIDAMREKHFQLIEQESKKPNPDYNKITQVITADTKKMLQGIFQEEMNKLGKAPCKLSFVTLGSMARKESGPITDLEIGILMEKKTIENYRYAYQLTQNISDRLFLLGEHPDIGGKGLRMDEADNAPPHLRFWARNLTPKEAKASMQEAIANREWAKIPYEGSRPFLATPAEFASYSKPEFTQDIQQLKQLKQNALAAEWNKAQKDPKNAQLMKTSQGQAKIKNDINYWVGEMYRPFSARELNIANSAGKKLGRNMDYLYGDKTLYNQFHQQREQIFHQAGDNQLNGRQNVAIKKMIDDISEQISKGDKSIYATGKLGKTLDIKRELYRFTEQFVTNLGFYHDCKSQNTIEILKELIHRKVISPTLGNDMINFIQYVAGLRLKEQSILKRQGFAMYLDEKEFADDKKDLEEKINQTDKKIQQMEKTPAFCQKEIAASKRERMELESKLEHLKEMAPHKILTPLEINTLQTKYLPMAKEIFIQASKWTQGAKQLGFDSVQSVKTVNPMPVIKPAMVERANRPLSAAAVNAAKVIAKAPTAKSSIIAKTSAHSPAKTAITAASGVTSPKAAVGNTMVVKKQQAVKGSAKAPIAQPIKAPAKAPITQAVKVPAKAPIAQPIKAPVKALIAQPIKVVAKAPIAAPVKTPITQAVKAPIKTTPISASKTLITKVKSAPVLAQPASLTSTPPTLQEKEKTANEIQKHFGSVLVAYNLVKGQYPDVNKKTFKDLMTEPGNKVSNFLNNAMKTMPRLI